MDMDIIERGRVAKWSREQLDKLTTPELRALLVNAERLSLMKPTAFFINTARGPIVDQAALTEALAARREELTPEGPHQFGGGYTEYVARTGQEAPGLRS